MCRVQRCRPGVRHTYGTCQNLSNVATCWMPRYWLPATSCHLLVATCWLPPPSFVFRVFCECWAGCQLTGNSTCCQQMINSDWRSQSGENRQQPVPGKTAKLSGNSCRIMTCTLFMPFMPFISRRCYYFFLSAAPVIFPAQGSLLFLTPVRWLMISIWQGVTPNILKNQRTIV